MDAQPLKSLEQIGREAKAAFDQADKAQTRADDLKITAGRLLLEAKDKIKKEGGKWLDFLKQHKLDERRSSEVMKIAKGETTSELLRKDNSARQAKHRNKSALRNADSFPDESRSVITSVKVEDKKVEEIKPVIDLKAPTSEVQVDTWEKDPRTLVLKTENQRLNSQIQQLNKRINNIGEQLDDASEPLAEYRQIKSWAEEEGQWDFIRDAAIKGRKRRK